MMIAIFVAVLLGSGLLVYLVLDRTDARTRSAELVNSSTTNAIQKGDKNPAEPSPPAEVQESNRSFFQELFGRESDPVAGAEAAGVSALRILMRFLVAGLLASLLAFGRRRSAQVQKRNPYVAQTQILLAVVAAAMMMIVGDSAARAFGIFAAASLVRFRTNIRDPKETSVLLICLGVGLASGVGRLEMALILTLFVLGTLLILEHFEREQVFRAMDLKVATKKVDQTNEVLQKLFKRHGFDAELREIDREDEEEPIGEIVYEVSLNAHISTDQLSEEILKVDAENIDKVEWEQKKSSTYIYN